MKAGQRLFGEASNNCGPSNIKECLASITARLSAEQLQGTYMPSNTLVSIGKI